ncbi:MAG: chromosome segregation protein SMC [Candidatus Krumholzibacteria bacterium]|nr:chromosome segregation protein SMC [Candidatus Krumholzibacteria bacterium]
MSLSRLELVGFKSFMNPVTLELRGGITCILGPNGCGKTNIVDAVRWVLGEQSARQLRSAKMENVIFNGTEVHKPTGYALVNMTVNNERGVFPLDYSEITITRKVYRSGISEYFINKAPCRLKDIRELFADTGTGSHSYAVIEQEMIDFVLNDSHGERRQMFEEAAGIVKYRMRREEAQRKLKLTENDLLRLDDIIEELGTNVRSLRYQVGKTKRYRRISERIRSYGIVMLKKSLSEHLASKREAESDLAIALEATRRDDLSLEESERAVSDEKIRLVELEKRYTEAQNRRYDVRRTIQASEERIIQASERMGEAQRTIERAGREIEEARSRLARIGERAEGVRTELGATGETIEGEQEEIRRLGGLFEEVRVKMDRLQTELIDLKQTQLDFIQDQARVRSTVEHFEKVIADLDERARTLRERIVSAETESARTAGERAAREEALGEAQKRLSSNENERDEATRRLREIERELGERDELLGGLRAETAGLRSRHDLFVRMREDFEGYPAGARHVLRTGDPRVRGALAEMIRTAPEYSRALEAVLGGMMDGIVVDGIGGAVDLVSGLSRENRGSARLIVDEPAWESGRAERVSAPGMIAPLADVVEAPEAASGAVRRLLEGVFLFDDLEHALSFIGSRDGAGASAVTVSGIYWCRGTGVYYAGPSGEEVSIFGRGGEIERLAGRIAEIGIRTQELEEACGILRSEKEAIIRRLAELAGEQADAREELARRRDEFQEIEREHITRREKTSLLMRSFDELEGARVEALSRLEEARLSLSMHEETGDMSDTGRIEAELSALRRRRDELDSLLTEKKVRIASLQGGLDRLGEELRGLGEMERQFRAIVEQRSVEAGSSREELARFERAIAEERAGVGGLLAQEQACEKDAESLRAELEGLRERIAALEGDLKKRAQERERIFERVNEGRVRLSSIDTRMHDLVERAREQHGEDLSCWLDGLETPLSGEEAAVTPEMLENEKRKLESLGPVNLAAVEEYDEKSQRLEFLEGQRGDLVKAKEELEEAIRTINKRARRLFLDTFTAVKKNFGEIFTVLFEGGEADLELGEGSDPLEAEIIIRARPKGKRVQDISLVSGGERALTAMALLFALYQTKPSPFCIFDEIDAPLDDSNVRRFIRMLKKFSADTQFIIITHNKRTMEAADRLFGVTMEEKGVSRIVSVDLTEIEDVLARKRPAAAAKREMAEAGVSSN